MPRWAKLVLLVAAAAGVVWALAPVGDVVQMIIFGGLLAYFLDPLAIRLEVRGMRRETAAALVFVGFLLAVGVPLVLLAPTLANQVSSLQEGFDLEVASDALAAVERRLGDFLAPLGVERPDLNERLSTFTEEHVGDLFGFVPGVLGIVTQIFVVPVIAFFVLRDGRRFRKQFIGLVPNRYFEFTLNVLRKADAQLGGYVRGQLLAALIVGVLATLALWVIGVEYYVIIGTIAGLANLIPFLGPLIGGAVAVAVSVVTTGSFGQVVPIAVAFTTIQIIDNVGTQPLLLSRNVELHPLAILLVLLVAGDLFGILGLLLAVPAAAVLKVLVQEFVTTFRSYHFSA